ncbi:hypothetical protein [Plantactinospora sp. GCM10030261]|uniref:hypothetical protein n=1 Tax=Plantactinospora sp. GCM10030261 TaxID=3273420 RepID=UPI003611A192
MHADPTAMIMSTRSTNRELYSARPDAPVVPYHAPHRTPRTVRARTNLAGLLRRAARAVEPPRHDLAGEPG